MALAELVLGSYERGSAGRTYVPPVRSYQSVPPHIHTGEVFDLDIARPRYRIADLKLKHVALQSQRPVQASQNATSNRPGISRWINLSVAGLLLTSMSIAAISFFVFLLEVSAGRPAFVLPSFSAFFIFSVVCLITLRLRKKLQFIQRDELSA